VIEVRRKSQDALAARGYPQHIDRDSALFVVHDQADHEKGFQRDCTARDVTDNLIAIFSGDEVFCQLPLNIDGR
jgi:hypothetical protein